MGMGKQALAEGADGMTGNFPDVDVLRSEGHESQVFAAFTQQSFLITITRATRFESFPQGVEGVDLCESINGN